MNTFLYVVEAPDSPATVTLELPSDWTIATSLTATNSPKCFYARSATELCDSPLLVGKLREWRMTVGNTPIRLAYCPQPAVPSFNEKPLLDEIHGIVQGAKDLFGDLPFREYVFQTFTDTPEAGLEHSDCVTLGLAGSGLPEAGGMRTRLACLTIAHEFFHAWNMMRIHPAEYKGPDYKPITISERWFSEGFTMFYSDLLLRRAGLPTFTPTRIPQCEYLIGRYLARHLDAHGSPEDASRQLGRLAMSNAPQDLWIEGELIAGMLDIQIRDTTDGKRSLDDLMRAMASHASGRLGFTARDVEQAASEVCGNNLKTFFDACVRGKRGIDFNYYLSKLGLNLDVQWKPLASLELLPFPEYELEARKFRDKPGMTAWLVNPNCSWSQAGLHTGDQLLKLNGKPLDSVDDFDRIQRSLHVGEMATMEFKRNNIVQTVAIQLGQFVRPFVTIREAPNQTDRQKALFASWSACK